MSQTNKVKEKNWEKVRELRKLHQPIFDATGVPGALYFPKMFYRPPDKDELYVSFFKSELQRGQDVYTEMVDREFNSEDPSRQLYQWKYNPQWAEDYEVTDSVPIRYLVPVSELAKMFLTDAEKIVKNFKEMIDMDTIYDDKGPEETTSEEKPEKEPDKLTGENDCSIDKMTVRDLLAIVQGMPVSHKKWLNKAIVECNNRHILNKGGTDND